ncbi:MAG: acyl-CoA dehydrogenase family protein, partial [Gammaproteobacteria bacterium]|nr:acyl-CoA dehydrogenase family protein [Gammaproteobacteria bacterium]
MSYQAPLRDMRFVLHELFDISSHCELLGNGLDRELIDGVLEEGARYTAEVVAPLNRNSDEQGCQLSDGQVTTPDGFAEAYQQYVDNGWASMTGPSEYGGQALPQMLACNFHEMLMSASLSFRVYSGLTEGAVLALYKHGSDALKSAYLEKLVSGQWAGTMCLTEPQAGTDLALLRSKAEPQADG